MASQMWREMLGKIINAPQERQRIANELGMSPITLHRWVTGESKPRPQSLRLLLQALPEHRQPFLAFLQEEFGADFVEAVEVDTLCQEIPPSFYARVLHAHCALPKIIRFNSVCDLILPYALKQLDPNQAGMYILIAQCMPPAQGCNVRSLRKGLTRSTYPSKRDLELPMVFYGREALVGAVIASGLPAMVRNRSEGQALYPVWWDSADESAIAYPIHLSNNIAGSLLVVSSLPDYFMLASRRQLVQQYAELMTVAFGFDAFYACEQIELGYMPARSCQSQSFALYRQRVAALTAQLHVSGIEAEPLVLQQLEAELLVSSTSH